MSRVAHKILLTKLISTRISLTAMQRSLKMLTHEKHQNPPQQFPPLGTLPGSLRPMSSVGLVRVS